VALLLAPIMVAVMVTVAAPASAAETPWFPDELDGRTPDTPSAVVNTGSPGEYRVVRGENGRIWWTQHLPEHWQEIPGGWQTGAAPSVVLVNGQLWVFIRGQNDTLVYYNRMTDLRNNRWSGWRNVPGTNGTSGTPTVTVAGNSLWLFTNIDGALFYHQYSFTGLIGWNSVRQVVPGGALTPSSPGVTTYGVNRDRIAVFHRGVNDRLYRQNFNVLNRHWEGSWRDLGGRILSRPTAAATGNLLDTVTVGVRGGDSRPWVITFGNGGNDVVHGWHPIQGQEGEIDDAPFLYANIARAAIFILVSRHLHHDLWGKRIE
jgi:hypothetical protein